MPEQNEKKIPEELLASIRSEAFSEAGKLILGAVASLLLIAFIGWWLYLKPKLIELLAGVPTGAVMSFDIREKCPSGWSEFDAGSGRFIIGAGKGDSLSPRPFGVAGGKETHTLTIRQIPAHKHGYVDWRSGDGACSFSGCNGRGGDVPKDTSSVGGTESGATDPFEIMPPFIALRFCKKD